MKPYVMRTLLSLLLLCSVFLTDDVNAQTWQPLGPDIRYEFGFDSTFQLNELRSINDTLYATLVGNHTVVKRFNGTVWDTLAASPYGTAGLYPASFPSVAITNSKNVYLFYPEPVTSPFNGNASVVKFSGSGWSQVGNTAFTNDTMMSLSIKTGKADTPYVLFRGMHRGMTVMKFNGSSWDTVGNRGFVNGHEAVLGFDTAGTPYVLFSDRPNLFRASVVKFNGNSWVSVSPFGGLSTLGVNNLSLRFDSLTNDLYVSYYDTATGTSVKKYSNNQWADLSASNLIGRPNNLEISKSGHLYLSTRLYGTSNDSVFVFKYTNGWFREGAKPLPNVNQAQFINYYNYYTSCFTTMKDTSFVAVAGISAWGGIVYKLNGSSWDKVGIYGIAEIPVLAGNAVSPLASGPIDFILDRSNTPITAFPDPAYGNKLSIMKYINGSWVYQGQPGLSTSAIGWVQLTRGKNDSIYVAFTESNVTKVGTYYNGVFTLLNYPYPGPPPYPGGPQIFYGLTTMVTDTAGLPYIAYPDLSNFNIVTVKNYNGTAWSTVTTLPSTGATKIAFDKQNNLYAFYPTSVGGYQLAKWSNGSWQSLGQITSGDFYLDPNDTPVLVSVVYRPNGIWSTSGTYQGFLQKLRNNSWVVATDSFYVAHSPYSGGPNLWYQIRLCFDTIGTPYVAHTGLGYGFGEDYLPVIEGWNGNNWKRINTQAQDWSISNRAAFFRLLSGSNNRLFFGLSYGAAYAWGWQVPPKPAPPLVSGNAISYCLGDTALPLSATGQNLLWYTSPSGTGSGIAPIPSTTSPGTYKWYVTQSPVIWESDMDSITVIVHPAPIPGITFNGTYLHATPGYVSCQWLFNGNPIPGATTDSLLPTLAGTYSVKVVDTNGCEGTSVSVFKPGPPMPTPAIVNYCLNDTPVALSAAGQNLLWYTSINGTGSATAPVPATNVAGVFKFYVSDASSIIESDKDSITVIVHPLPSPSVTYTNGYLQSSGLYVSYQWYFNGSIITGATIDFLAPLLDGSYTVEVEDTNGCKGLSAPFIITSVNDIHASTKLVVYPNPVTGRSFEILSGEPLQGAVGIALVNSLGQIVYRNERKPEAGGTKIHVELNSGIPPGVYQIRLKTRDKMLVTSIVFY